MKKILLLAVLSFALIFTGCKTTKTVKRTPVPDGYQGIYVVKIWEGDNSVLPKDLTGLVLKRMGNSYKIMLSNIDVSKKSAEEIEELPYKYKDGTFFIKFGGIMKVKPEKDGLRGTLDHSGKAKKLYLKKIK